MVIQEKNTERVIRPPVVVVMGHVDHGKTQLLDTIRKSNVVAQESGGITQHIGAYEVVHKGKRITFLDTPGHEAFGKMRARGARVADVAILVVAADDGVKPQTLEALSAIREAGIPFVVALNKIDKSEANPDRAKKDLSENNVLIEEWGGKVPLVEISAKDGTNIDELLDMVFLVAELEELKTDNRAPASGAVIEARRDTRRGNSATLLVTDGVLREGAFVLAGKSSTKVKILENFQGERIHEAAASMPVRVIGFDAVPEVGTEFRVYETKKELEENIGKLQEKTEAARAVSQAAASDVLTVPILIKADVAGSLEAIEDAVRKLSFENAILKFVGGGVGDIGEGDIKAVATEKRTTGALIVGFRSKVTPEAHAAAERFGVRIGTFDVIYEAVEWAENAVERLIPKEVTKEKKGTLEVLKVFTEDKGNAIIGGKVTEGVVQKGNAFILFRRGIEVASGVITNLEQDKQKVSEVIAGNLCGLSITHAKGVAKGDTLEAFVGQ